MFQHYCHPGVRSEVLGAVTASSRGTNVTASATANAKGTYVDIGTSNFTYELISLNLLGQASVDYLVDVAISVGGNRFIIAPDLRLDHLRFGRSGGLILPLPLHIPSGSVLSARCQASTGSSVCAVTITGFSAGIAGAPGYSRMVSLFTSPGSSRGVLVDPGGTANTKARTQIISSSAQPIAAVLALVGAAGDNSRAGAQDWLWDIETGGSGAEFAIAAGLTMGAESTADTVHPNQFGPFPCNVASASRFTINAQCSVNTTGDRTFDVGLYGFVP